MVTNVKAAHVTKKLDPTALAPRALRTPSWQKTPFSMKILA